ncbi:MAG: type I DNA topoisomerase [Propionibacteriaceae bacterium]|jgi:DNA topoisomerase-1|nr:type I DNA topoisomerase [Propionibacteriaceae bacterium]
MAHKTLVIVESPTKATKIASYLGPDYIVESSRGHIRDLPTTAAEIPAKYKKEPWARLGVDVDHDFAPIYVVSSDKKATIATLKKDLADVDQVLLATDEDREGEAIAWHLLEALKPKVPVKRMVFHEITPAAIQAAVKAPRQLDMDLVDAQETRRILDRLYGYEISPVLWRKVLPRLSAGRVQSVATRLIVDREKERIAFRSAAFWDVTARLDAGASAQPPQFTARLTQVAGQKLATGRDFSAQGVLTSSALVLNETGAEAISAAIRQGTLAVAEVDARPYTRHPYEPFRTTTLQQEAGRKLGFSAQRTMSVAQQLYEAGWITYMRTDSVTLSDQAISAARAAISQLFGAKYLPTKPRLYASKVKNAQEAHEAIRPAGDVFRSPEQSGLAGEQLRLYELVWRRTLASQMADAAGQSVTVKIDAHHAEVDIDGQATDHSRLQASGRTITFAGFLKAYVASSDDPDQSSDDAQAQLPQLTAGQSLTAVELTPVAHQTKPPARYTEPSLVARLEDLEIGRPSTYASIIRTITARDYVFKQGSALVPTWLAFSVTRLLEEQFPQLVDYAFTARMESDLDAVARGDERRLDVLNQFYFGLPDHQGLQQLVNQLDDVDPRQLSSFAISGDEGLILHVGKFGPYVEDPLGRRAQVPEDLAPDELTEPRALQLLDTAAVADRIVGQAAATGYDIVAKQGRFGPYLTEVLPEDAPKSVKARTAGLFKSMTVDDVTLEQAEALLALPRVVGQIDGETITAQNGRYGAYLKRGTTSRSLPSEESIFTISLDEAKQLLDQAPVRGPRAATILKELGNDPVNDQAVTVKSGRFGPYITDGETNVTLRQDDTVETITAQRAFELLAEKRAKGPTPKRSRSSAKSAGGRKAAASKTSSTRKATAAKTSGAKTSKTTAPKP